MTSRPTLLLALFLACTAPPPPAPTPAPAPPPPPVTVTVTATYEGASPPEVERSLTTPLEQAVTGTPDLTDLRSTTRSGRAELLLTFAPGTDATTARAAVQARLQPIQPTLPEATLPPIVGAEHDPNTAVLFILQSSRAAPDELGRTATDIRRSLLAISNVTDVAMCGLRTPELEISLDPTRLTAFGLATSTVVTTLRNSLSPTPLSPTPLTSTPLGAGTSLAAPRSAEDIADLVLATREAAIHLRDVATIRSTLTRDTCGAVRLGAGGVILTVVHARRGAPADEFYKAVRADLDARRPDLHARQIDLDVPPHALRVALDLEATMDPTTELTDHAERLRGLFQAANILPLAYLQAPTPTMLGEWLPADLFVIPGSADEAAALRDQLAKLPDVRTIGSPADPAADPQLHRTWITGDDRDTTIQIGTYLADMLRGVPGITRPRLRDQQELERVLKLDRDKLAVLGLATADVQATLGVGLDGLRVGTMPDRDTAIPIVVRLAAGDDTVRPLSPVSSLTVQPASGPPVPVDTLVRIQLALHPAEILHNNRARAVLVEWFSSDPNAPRAAQDRVARELHLPAGVAVIWE